MVIRIEVPSGRNSTVWLTSTSLDGYVPSIGVALQVFLVVIINVK